MQRPQVPKFLTQDPIGRLPNVIRDEGLAFGARLNFLKDMYGHNIVLPRCPSYDFIRVLRSQTVPSIPGKPQVINKLELLEALIITDNLHTNMIRVQVRQV